MTMSVMSSNYQQMWDWQPRPLAQNAGISYNLQNDIAEQNAKSGSKLDLNKQIASANINIVV
jgi:hypothetical protein